MYDHKAWLVLLPLRRRAMLYRRVIIHHPMIFCHRMTIRRRAPLCHRVMIHHWVMMHHLPLAATALILKGWGRELAGQNEPHDPAL